MIGVVGAITVLLGVILGSGAIFDFSQTTTTIGQIGDNIINNYIENELGISLDKYRDNCSAGVYDNSDAGQFCDIFIGG